MPNSSADAPALTRVRPLLGTFVSIRVPGGASEAGQAKAASAVEMAFERIAEVQRCMSFQDPYSDLSRINSHAHRAPQAVCDQLWRVLRAALALAAASQGRFDPCVAGKLVEWGLLPVPAAPGAPVDGRVDPRATWRDVELRPDRRVRYAKPLWLDLGGIAKGYAVDQAVRVLQRQGLAAGIVNAGGDLRCFGATETIKVRDPAEPSRLLPLLQLRDAAAATSAGYFAEGQHTALVHPGRARSMGQGVSVTVCAPRAIWADALTKVVLADPAGAPPLLARCGARAMLLHADGARRALN
jgi:thiamine biosynthesis lipoprotein